MRIFCRILSRLTSSSKLSLSTEIWLIALRIGTRSTACLTIGPRHLRKFCMKMSSTNYQIYRAPTIVTYNYLEELQEEYLQNLNLRVPWERPWKGVQNEPPSPPIIGCRKSFKKSVFYNMYLNSFTIFIQYVATKSTETIIRGSKIVR